MVSQGTVKGDGIFSPSLLSVYRYAYMTGFSVTIVGISLCPDSALSLSESVIRSYINFATFPNQNSLKINGLQLGQWWHHFGYGGHVWYIPDMLGVVGRQLLIPVYMDVCLTVTGVAQRIHS